MMLIHAGGLCVYDRRKSVKFSEWEVGEVLIQLVCYYQLVVQNGFLSGI